MSDDREGSDPRPSEDMRKLLSSLTVSEAKKLREIFGLSDVTELESVVKEFEVTRAKIREIEARALEKLRGGKGPDDAA